MENLALYASIAEIFSAAAIVGGALFALVQLAEYKRRRRNQMAVELCRQFTEPSLGRAAILLMSLPDGMSLKEFSEIDSEYEEAAQLMGMTFETMGLMVHKDIASFDIVQELAGGLLMNIWRKVEIWVKEMRVKQGNPRFGEWVQWLAERLQEAEPEITPAYEQHANWKGHRH